MRKNIIVLVTIIVFSSFLFFNIYAFCSKESKYNNQKTSTTKTTVEPSSELIQDKILIKDEEKNIYVRELISHLGFTINIIDRYFSISHMSNGALKISLEDAEENFILIEKLQENVYYKEYKDLNTKEIVRDKCLINYKFLKGSVLTYLKITKSVDINSQKFEEINAYLDYMISSLTLTS